MVLHMTAVLCIIFGVVSVAFAIPSSRDTHGRLEKVGSEKRCRQESIRVCNLSVVECHFTRSDCFSYFDSKLRIVAVGPKVSVSVSVEGVGGAVGGAL